MANNLSDFLRLSGFHQSQNIAYGRQFDIFVNVKFNKLYMNAYVDIFIHRPEGINLSEINLYLKENKKKFKANSAVLGEGYISIMLNSEVKRIKADHALMFVQDIAEFLTEKGYKSACTFCKTDEFIGHSYQDSKIKEVCETCHQKLDTVVEDMQQQRETSGTYPRGFLGAALGGLIGIIPWILLGFIGYVASISGMIMAFLAHKGYVLLKGKIGKGMIAILIIVLVIFTYVGVLASQSVVEYRALADMGYEIRVFELVKIMMIAPFLPNEFEVGVLWGQIGLGLFFTAIGSFVILRKANKQASGKDIKVKRIGEDLK